jgi:hypothetical protein
VDRLVVDEPDLDARAAERGAVRRDGDGLVLLAVPRRDVTSERLPEPALPEENVLRALVRILAQNGARLARRDAREPLREPRGRALLEHGHGLDARELIHFFWFVVAPKKEKKKKKKKKKKEKKKKEKKKKEKEKKEDVKKIGDPIHQKK